MAGRFRAAAGAGSGGAMTGKHRPFRRRPAARPRILAAALAAATALLLAALAILAGCSSSTELGGAKVPNALPDTRIVGRPPVLRAAGFAVHFSWTGSDPDGKIRGFQWKISDNGVDGIGLRDTLTIDPATGDTLHPWRPTTATDTTFIVKADLPGLPDDAHLPPRDQRSFQTHTLFVRAVDDQGGVDPTPAMLSFTATTLTPMIIVDRPSSLSSYRAAQFAPPSVTFGWSGADPDFDTAVPTKVRYLWKPARLPGGNYLMTEFDYNQNVEFVCSFKDSAWSDWLPYKSKAEERMVTFANQPQRDPQGRTIGYLFAIQAQDTTGAVSPDRTYARNVHNVVITSQKTPLLTLQETYLGMFQDVGLTGLHSFDIAQGQPLNFSWTAEAESYAGIVMSYRYGWDVADPTNENDPGWAVQPGLSLLHRKSPQNAFSTGTHTLTVQAMDNSNQVTRVTVILNVVPVPQPADQSPLLVVDDVYDHNSNGWVGLDGRSHDNDIYRDAFWLQTVSGSGGVAEFLPSRDVVDLEENRVFGYRDVVNYRSIIWEEKKGTQSYVWTNFDPVPGERFVWLGIYQQQVGHVLLCGQQAMLSFLGDQGMLTGSGQAASWMFPIILDANEDYYYYNSQRYAIGSGTRLLPDGTTVMLGKIRYPYSVWGVVGIDEPSHNWLIYPGVPGSAGVARRSNCAGMKGLVLDPVFRTSHLDPGAIADTILTWSVVDYRDYPAAPNYPDLHASFIWGLDEFYDHNATTRPTPIVPQLLRDGRPAVEPMFRLLSRYEWIRGLHVARGDAGWPLASNSPFSYDAFDQPGLRATCTTGDIGNGNLFDLSDPPRTKVDGTIVGFVSHKTELTKPTAGGDVLWGFDPSRFDPAKIQKAIRWVLGQEFGLRMTAQ